MKLFENLQRRDCVSLEQTHSGRGVSRLVSSQGLTVLPLLSRLLPRGSGALLCRVSHPVTGTRWFSPPPVCGTCSVLEREAGQMGLEPVLVQLLCLVVGKMGGRQGQIRGVWEGFPQALTIKVSPGRAAGRKGRVRGVCKGPDVDTGYFQNLEKASLTRALRKQQRPSLCRQQGLQGPC